MYVDRWIPASAGMTDERPSTGMYVDRRIPASAGMTVERPSTGMYVDRRIPASAGMTVERPSTGMYGRSCWKRWRREKDVIPAQAGIQWRPSSPSEWKPWIPASAGVTDERPSTGMYVDRHRGDDGRDQSSSAASISGNSTSVNPNLLKSRTRIG
jgi:hypothetical protein